MPSITVGWSSGPGELARLAEPWDELASLDSMPFSGTDWLQAWLTAFRAHRRLVVCTVWRGRELVAGMPLLRSERCYAAPVNDHTPLFRPVFRDDKALHALAEAVVDPAPAVLQVAGVPDDDATVTSVCRAAERRGMLTLVEPQHISPLVDLSCGPEAYWASVGPRVREHQRRRRKMHREHDVELVLAERPVDLGRHVDHGFALEAAGWKGRAGSAIDSARETAGFYRELVRRFDRRGELRVSSLWLDGEIAAFDLALLHQGRYHLLKTAYDEQRRALGPGMVLRLAVLERCVDLGLVAHEFLGPDMPWKRVFSNGERRHCALRAFDRSPAGLASYSYRRRIRPLLREAYSKARGSTEAHRG